jgi:hypothetical protein
VKIFHNPTTEAKFRQLGFAQDGLFFKLRLGDVTVYAAEHPLKGLSLTFESFTPRTMCQYEATLPEFCSAEKIAGLIYVNIRQNFADSKDIWKTHLEHLGGLSIQ